MMMMMMMMMMKDATVWLRTLCSQQSETRLWINIIRLPTLGDD